MNRIMTLLRERHEQYDELHSHHQGQSRTLYGPWHLCTFDLANHLQSSEFLEVTEIGKIEPDGNGEGGQAFDIAQLGFTLDSSMRTESFLTPIRITLVQCKLPELQAPLEKWGEEQGVQTSNPD